MCWSLLLLHEVFEMTNYVLWNTTRQNPQNFKLISIVPMEQSMHLPTSRIHWQYSLEANAIPQLY